MMTAPTIAPPASSSSSSSSSGTTTGKPTKRWTWTKPKSKPKRPLSAYNLFFRNCRQKLISGHSIEAAALYDPTLPETVAKMLDDTAAERRAAEAALAAGRVHEIKPRSHKSKHGKCGFKDMARSIADRWKNLDAESRRIYEGAAEVEKRRYREELGRWKARQQKEKKVKKNSTANKEGDEGDDDDDEKQRQHDKKKKSKAATATKKNKTKSKTKAAGTTTTTGPKTKTKTATAKANSKRSAKRNAERKRLAAIRIVQENNKQMQQMQQMQQRQRQQATAAATNTLQANLPTIPVESTAVHHPPQAARHHQPPSSVISAVHVPTVLSPSVQSMMPAYSHPILAAAAAAQRAAAAASSSYESSYHHHHCHHPHPHPHHHPHQHHQVVITPPVSRLPSLVGGGSGGTAVVSARTTAAMTTTSTASTSSTSILQQQVNNVLKAAEEVAFVDGPSTSAAAAAAAAAITLAAQARHQAQARRVSDYTDHAPVAPTSTASTSSSTRATTSVASASTCASASNNASTTASAIPNWREEFAAATQNLLMNSCRIGLGGASTLAQPRPATTNVSAMAPTAAVAVAPLTSLHRGSTEPLPMSSAPTAAMVTAALEEEEQLGEQQQQLGQQQQQQQQEFTTMAPMHDFEGTLNDVDPAPAHKKSCAPMHRQRLRRSSSLFSLSSLPSIMSNPDLLAMFGDSKGDASAFDLFGDDAAITAVGNNANVAATSHDPATFGTDLVAMERELSEALAESQHDMALLNKIGAMRKSA